MRKLLLFAATLAAAGVLVISGGLTQAQYPEVVGSITTTSGATVAVVGSTTTLTCELLDAGGDPIAGEICTFSILSEPGDDAALGSKVVSKVTGPNGIATATLFVGSTPGPIIVQTEAQGLRSSVVVMVTLPSPAPPPAAPISPSASVPTQLTAPGLITPPSTGDGGIR